MGAWDVSTIYRCRSPHDTKLGGRYRKRHFWGHLDRDSVIAAVYCLSGMGLYTLIKFGT